MIQTTENGHAADGDIWSALCEVPQLPVTPHAVQVTNRRYRRSLSRKKSAGW
ncbi:MAG: hypothetical protein R3B47_10535 [Bacteroidia bacterium]